MIIIVGDYTPFTGNHTTLMRLREILALRYRTMPFDITKDKMIHLLQYKFYCQKDNKKLIMICLNANRCKKILQHINIPYVLIAGGTDVNKNMYSIKQYFEKAWKVISFTECMKKTLHLHIKKQVHVIPQSQPRCIISNRWIRKKLNIKHKDILVLLPAGIRPVKDVTYLLNAIKQWNNETDHRIVLVVIGPVRDKDYYKKVKDIKLDFFKIHGPVKSPNLCAAMTEADIVVNTSISEGMSGALLEAMSLGCFIMARNINANRELILQNNEPCGVLFDSPKMFVKLAKQNLKQNNIFRDNARKYVDSKFNFIKEREAYMRIFESTV